MPIRKIKLSGSGFSGETAYRITSIVITGDRKTGKPVTREITIARVGRADYIKAICEDAATIVESVNSLDELKSRPKTLLQVTTDTVHAYVSTMKRSDVPTVPQKALDRICALVEVRLGSEYYRDLIEGEIRNAVACAVEEGYKL